MGGDLKNIVICFDGTGADVRASSNTNVVQLFRRLCNERDRQLTYYDPGVGTFSAAGAWTTVAQRISRLSGLAFGAGMRTNLEEAYAFLIDHWEPGDRLFLFGFSRGAYCARALTGMLHLIGIMRPGSGNLVRYAVSNYARRKPKWGNEDWKQARQFASVMSQYVHGHPGVPVAYLGLWDTVKAPGIFRRSMEWPVTRILPNVERGRHAVSIDEKRRPFREYLVDAKQTAIEEVWFAGVHSDVGGGFLDQPRLGDIALDWITDGARAAGILLREDRRFAPVTVDNSTGAIHTMGWYWALLTIRRRPIPATARIHASVKQRMAKYPDYGRGRVPSDSWADINWPARSDANTRSEAEIPPA